jgi:hypothetical protein
MIKGGSNWHTCKACMQVYTTHLSLGVTHDFGLYQGINAIDGKPIQLSICTSLALGHAALVLAFQFSQQLLGF